MFALKDVSKILNLKPYQIQHCIAVGSVPEPRLRISGRRVFEMADVRRLAKHFGVTLKANEAVAAEAE